MWIPTVWLLLGSCSYLFLFPAPHFAMQSLMDSVRAVGSMDVLPKAFAGKFIWRPEELPQQLEPTVWMLFVCPCCSHLRVRVTGSGSNDLCSSDPEVKEPDHDPEVQEPYLDCLPACYYGICMDSVAFEPYRRPKIYKRCPLPYPGKKSGSA